MNRGGIAGQLLAHSFADLADARRMRLLAQRLMNNPGYDLDGARIPFSKLQPRPIRSILSLNLLASEDRRESPIDSDDLARDPVVFRVYQPRDERGDILWFADSPQRMHRARGGE